MLVPVQYRRIMAAPDFDSYDLSAFQMKFSTSAPFAPALKADVLKRWPGGLVEYYGMTEGGGACMLVAHEHPDKLHTVGQPMAGHDIRLIDEEDRRSVRRDRRGGRALGVDDERLSQPARQDLARRSGSSRRDGASSAPATSGASTRTAS